VSDPHVLVARLDNVGDVLLTGPAVRAVAAGARRVDYMCSAAGRPAAELLPGVDHVLTYDAPWVGFEPRDTDRAVFDEVVERVAQLGVDQAFIFTSFHQSPLPLALMFRLAGVGTIAAASVDFPGGLLDVRHRQVEGHEVEQSLSLVATLGYRLGPGDGGELRLREPLARTAPFPEPYIVVHPGASVPARALDAAVARDAVDELVRAGWRVAVTGSAGEAALTAHVAGHHGDQVLDLAGTHDLRGLAGVLAGAEAVVVGNTGPAHLAASVGTPVVSVFAPVVPVGRWGPWRVPTRILGDQSIGCWRCRARRCPLPEQLCLRPVTADAIIDAVHSLAAAPRAVTS
jgi:ADP-heptose:LPS heptosyltransferase